MNMLSRLDAGFLNLVNRLAAAFIEWSTDPDNRFLNWLADAMDRLDDVVEHLAQRWEKRQREVQRTHVGSHRLAGRVRPFDRADYEWGKAIKAMAARMEGEHAWRCD